MNDGWVKTGNLAYMGEGGFVFIVDRAKDMIATGGEEVVSAEVESVISAHPGVSGVAVLGIPHETWGEAVHAIVIPANGAQIAESEIIDHCHLSLARYKCAKSIAIRAEPFPPSGAGKVLKRELRVPCWEGRKRLIS